MTIEEAGNYYLDAVCPVNALQESYGKAIDKFNKNTASNSIRPVARYAGRIAKADRDQADALKNPLLPWPSEVKDDVAKVASSALADIASMQAAGSATTLSDFNDAFTGRANADTGAQAVRSDLHLGTNTTTSCYGHPGYLKKKVKAKSRAKLFEAKKVIGTYPSGYPKIVEASSLPSFAQPSLAGAKAAVEVADGVYIAAKDGRTEQQVLDSGIVVGLCSAVTRYEKFQATALHLPGTCFTKTLVTPKPKL